mmetsp:Transcript_8/g.41  ORF Transcript_8/g.41 Transcript_8/m.41 type:complete len:234 (+) Transcript_8:2338-3039(+)
MSLARGVWPITTFLHSFEILCPGSFPNTTRRMQELDLGKGVTERKTDTRIQRHSYLKALTVTKTMRKYFAHQKRARRIAKSVHSAKPKRMGRLPRDLSATYGNMMACLLLIFTCICKFHCCPTPPRDALFMSMRCITQRPPGWAGKPWQRGTVLTCLMGPKTAARARVTIANPTKKGRKANLAKMGTKTAPKMIVRVVVSFKAEHIHAALTKNTSQTEPSKGSASSECWTIVA